MRAPMTLAAEMQGTLTDVGGPLTLHPALSRLRLRIQPPKRRGTLRRAVGPQPRRERVGLPGVPDLKLTAAPRLLLTALLSLLPAAASAQASATLDASTTRISYADGAGTTGVSVSPGFQIVRPWRSLAASGSWSRFDGGIWSIQGHVAGSTYLPAVRGLRPEVELLAGGTRHQDGGGSGELDAALRLHWLRNTVGVWGGLVAGHAYNGDEWGRRLTGEAGVWTRVGPGVMTFTLSASKIGADLDYGEAESAFRVSRGPLELVAYGGLRHWLRPDASGSGWAGATAAWWVNNRVAVTLAGGAYPANYAQGLPEGSFGAVGIRLATGRVARTRRVYEPLDLLIPPVAPGAAAFEVRRGALDTLTLTLRGMRAESVEIMGDFTSWQTVSLQRTGADTWSVALPIPPGLHRLNLRTDGGTWQAPPGMTAINDEFGGPTGVLIVE